MVTSMVDSQKPGLRPKVLSVLQRISDFRTERAVMSPQVSDNVFII